MAPMNFYSQRTQKPILYGRHWVAVTGKPIAATAGARTFMRGGNAVDAACAMIAATSTMWDTLSGAARHRRSFTIRTRARSWVSMLLGVAPTGATAAFYKGKGMNYPPEYGPLAAVTPGTPGGIMVMLAEYGKLCLKDVLARRSKWPTATQWMTKRRATSSGKNHGSNNGNIRPPLCCRTSVQQHEGPAPGEIFRQAGPGRNFTQARRRRAEGTESGEVTQRGHHGRVRSILSRRHRQRVCSRCAGRGRPDHRSRILPNGRCISRSPSRQTTRASTFTN